MQNHSIHTFHIPVMGLGFTIDTPIKVAHFGISSVVSVMEDGLLELMRKHYSEVFNFPFHAIDKKEFDARAKRITAFLNLLNKIVNQQFDDLKKKNFGEINFLDKYFDLLPDTSALKTKYNAMLAEPNIELKNIRQQELKNEITKGAIDINIMSKVDKNNYSKCGELMDKEYADAMSALRGFAQSDLHSSVVFSAGYNPRLYNYVEQFEDFFPDENGVTKKKIILKVSDFRSAEIQGKLLAKKGVFVAEFRIESGLNCGGHAFATNGILLGPVLEEFKNHKLALKNDLLQLCNKALEAKGKIIFKENPDFRITVQGGIGTYHEDSFLIKNYHLDGTGWGSPFLLVPEATNVDESTLHDLTTATPQDFYLSNASPLGVPFNNFRKSSSEEERLKRIENNKPGSPCYRKFLALNTEFGKPICTASRAYQSKKIKELENEKLSPEIFKQKFDAITEKACLCTGLSTPALLVNKLKLPNKLKSVAICPGPNLAFFSGTFSLKQMVDHIYGRTNILNAIKRPNLFMNELKLYVDYLKKEIEKQLQPVNSNTEKYFVKFKKNLLDGIDYYKNIINSITTGSSYSKMEMELALTHFENEIREIMK